MALADFNDSERFSLNKDLSILVFNSGSFISFLREETARVLLDTESPYCASHRSRVASISRLICILSLWPLASSALDNASPRQEIAAANRFCLYSINLSRLRTVSLIAAFTSAFKTGAPINLQFSGKRYFSQSSLRISLFKPLVAIWLKRAANSGRIPFEYSCVTVGSSPKISRMSSSRASSAGAVMLPSGIGSSSCEVEGPGTFCEVMTSVAGGGGSDCGGGSALRTESISESFCGGLRSSPSETSRKTISEMGKIK